MSDYSFPYDVYEYYITIVVHRLRGTSTEGMLSGRKHDKFAISLRAGHLGDLYLTGKTHYSIYNVI